MFILVQINPTEQTEIVQHRKTDWLNLIYNCSSFFHWDYGTFALIFRIVFLSGTIKLHVQVLVLVWGFRIGVGVFGTDVLNMSSKCILKHIGILYSMMYFDAFFSWVAFLTLTHWAIGKERQCLEQLLAFNLSTAQMYFEHSSTKWVAFLTLSLWASSAGAEAW